MNTIKHKACVCGKPFDANHAQNCPTGGFPTARHNEVQDLLVSLLTEVCQDVAVEPVLQPITGETFQQRSTSTDNGACLDIRARGFWGSQSESAFLTSGSLIVTHPRTTTPPLLPATVAMSKPNRTCIRSTSVKWSVPRSLL